MGVLLDFPGIKFPPRFVEQNYFIEILEPHNQSSLDTSKHKIHNNSILMGIWWSILFHYFSRHWPPSFKDRTTNNRMMNVSISQMKKDLCLRNMRNRKAYYLLHILISYNAGIKRRWNKYRYSNILMFLLSAFWETEYMFLDEIWDVLIVWWFAMQFIVWKKCKALNCNFPIQNKIYFFILYAED